MEDYEKDDPGVKEIMKTPMEDYEKDDPKTEEIMEASLNDSEKDVQRMHKEGMEVVMYVRDEEV